MNDLRSPKHELMDVEDNEAFVVALAGAPRRVGLGSRNPTPPLPLFALREQEGTPTRSQIAVFPS